VEIQNVSKKTFQKEKFMKFLAVLIMTLAEVSSIVHARPVVPTDLIQQNWCFAEEDRNEYMAIYNASGEVEIKKFLGSTLANITGVRILGNWTLEGQTLTIKYVNNHYVPLPPAVDAVEFLENQGVMKVSVLSKAQKPIYFALPCHNDPLPFASLIPPGTQN
jgi:hypothetical protein